MINVTLEILRACLLAGILYSIIRKDKFVQHGRKGWLLIKLGFTFLLLGATLDITDNFHILNPVVIIGDTPVESFIEKVFGYIGGFTLIGLGLRSWLPSLSEYGITQEALENTQRTLEHKVIQRTAHLEKEIDHHRRSKNALLQEEEKRRMLYDNAPVAIAHGSINENLSRNGHIRHNNAFGLMLGYSGKEDLEKTLHNAKTSEYLFYDINDLAKLLELLRIHRTVNHFEVQMNCKDTSVIWVNMEVTTVPDHQGKSYYFYAFATDITARKKATLELAASESRLKTILHTLPIGLYLADYETLELTDINPAALAMTGFTDQSIIGKTCCSTLCKERTHVCKAMASEPRSEPYETYVLRKDGTPLPVIKSVADVMIANKRHLLVTFIDISEQKRLEQIKEDVDRIVKHDVKSPIISIINACSLLLMNDDLDEESRSILEDLKMQGHKVMRMIGMSLTLYRMEAGTYEYEPEPVNLVASVARIQAELQGQARLSNVGLQVTLHGRSITTEDTLIARGVPLLCDSMLANLIKNAIEASPHGESVSIAMTDNDQPQIHITNTGVVPPNIRDTFFHKYITEGKSTGSGLGTYSATLVAETFGGSVTMETSDEENRTIITVTLQHYQD